MCLLHRLRRAFLDVRLALVRAVVVHRGAGARAREEGEVRERGSVRFGRESRGCGRGGRGCLDVAAGHGGHGGKA